MISIPGLGKFLDDLAHLRERAIQIAPTVSTSSTSSDVAKEETPAPEPTPEPPALELGKAEFVPPPAPAMPERAPLSVDPSDVEAMEDAQAGHVADRQTIADAAAERHHPKLPKGKKPDVVIQIPAPRAWMQAEVLDSPHRFKAMRAGRRSGKTRVEFIAGVRGHGPFINVEKDPSKPPIHVRMFKGIGQGGDIVWIAPDYGQANALWEEEILPRFEGRPGVTVSEKHKLIGLGRELGVDRSGEPIYRGSLRMRSAENINSVRGKKFDGAIIDEAAFLNFFPVWKRVIRPTLIDRKGWAIIASSTDMGSDFNHLMVEVEAQLRGPSWRGWHFRTKDNPYIDAEELQELAREYAAGSAEEQQELGAELLETLGTLFRAEFFHHYDAINNQAVWVDGLRYPFEFLVMTVDLASRMKEEADFTSITIAGVCYPIDGIRRVAIIHNHNERLEGPEQIDAMEEFAKVYRPAYIDIENTQYQETAVQHLERRLKGQGLTITGIPSSKDKRTRAVPAASAMSRGEWLFPKPGKVSWYDDLHSQLLKFPNGKDKSKFVADHDDIVDTFSLLAARVGGRTNTSWKVRKVRTR